MPDWYTIREIFTNVFAIAEELHWERVRSYLFRGDDMSWLIDSGTGIGNLGNALSELTDSEIRIITTHVHWDHIGHHGKFDKVYVHKADAGWLINGLPLPLPVIRQQMAKESFDVPCDSDFRIEEYAPPTVQNPRIVYDGEILTGGGFELEIVHTPGHSPGSICVLERRTGLLATGDLVYRGTIFANYSSTDPAAILRSFRRLHEIPGITGILPGHNDSILDTGAITEGLALLEEIEKQGNLQHGTGLHRGESISFLF